MSSSSSEYTSSLALNTSGASSILNGYAVASPTACLVAPKTSGSPINKSNMNFIQKNNGLTYIQYPDSRYTIQTNDSSSPLHLDFSLPTQLSISDGDDNTLILYENKSHAVYTGLCEVAVFGMWKSDATPGVTKRQDIAPAIFDKRQKASWLCKDIQFFCSNHVRGTFTAVAENSLCFALGQRISQTVGGAIGFLGNALGPEVGIPTTIAGVAIGGRIGSHFATLYANDLCAAAMHYRTSKMCAACPDPKLCGEGTLKCSVDGPCRDVLSDPDNCGACGNMCPSNRCRNGQCTQPTCNKSICGGLNMCSPSCYCFTTAGGTGFCGPSTPCAGLTDCNSDYDLRGWCMLRTKRLSSTMYCPRNARHSD